MIKISQVPIEWLDHEAYRSVIETPKGRIECELSINWGPGELMPMRLFINTTSMAIKEAMALASVAGYFEGEFATVDELIAHHLSMGMGADEENSPWPSLFRKHFQ